MIKLPKSFIDAGYKFEAKIPAPKFETVRTPEGSFALRVGFEANEIKELAREAAIEMTDKVEAAIMDELLRLNGYVPERTCTFSVYKTGDKHFPTCSACGYEAARAECEDYVGVVYYEKRFCPNCGARLVEE